MVTKLFFTTFLVLGSLKVYSSEAIRISGSSTIFPVSQKLILSYKNKNLTFTTNTSTSSEGLDKLLSGETDIARMSRGFSKKEIFKIKQNNKNIRPFKIGYDAVCIIASPTVTEEINKISKKELREIFFSGKIDSWNQISKKLKGEIKIFAPNKASGTSKVFLEFMDRSTYSNNVKLLEKSLDIVEAIEKTPNSIGIASYGIISQLDIDTLNYSSDGKVFYKCSAKMLKERKYELVRGLFFVVEYPPKESVARFLDYVLDRQGQSIIEDFGMVPVR